MCAPGISISASSLAWPACTARATSGGRARCGTRPPSCCGVTTRFRAGTRPARAGVHVARGHAAHSLRGSTRSCDATPPAWTTPGRGAGSARTSFGTPPLSVLPFRPEARRNPGLAASCLTSIRYSVRHVRQGRYQGLSLFAAAFDLTWLTCLSSGNGHLPGTLPFPVQISKPSTSWRPALRST